MSLQAKLDQLFSLEQVRTAAEKLSLLKHGLAETECSLQKLP
ncbi:MAG: hypothetical protein V2B20_26320 [Pseudomonadota bacterium]